MILKKNKLVEVGQIFLQFFVQFVLGCFSNLGLKSFADSVPNCP